MKKIVAILIFAVLQSESAFAACTVVATKPISGRFSVGTAETLEEALPKAIKIMPGSLVAIWACDGEFAAVALASLNDGYQLGRTWGMTSYQDAISGARKNCPAGFRCDLEIAITGAGEISR